MNITFKDKNLFLNGKTVTFETNVDNVVIFERVCVVLLMDDLVPDNNVYAYDLAGNCIWNISQIIEQPQPDAYVSMAKVDANLLRVISYNGFEFLIDISCNSLVNKTITK